MLTAIGKNDIKHKYYEIPWGSGPSHVQVTIAWWEYSEELGHTGLSKDHTYTTPESGCFKWQPLRAVGRCCTCHSCYAAV